MAGKLIKNKVFAGVVITVLIAFLSLILISLNVFESWEFKASDTLYLDENRASEDIVIVSIDPKSIDEGAGLGRFQDWSREYYAQTLLNIQEFEPKVVGVDLLFFEYSRGVSGFSLENLLSDEAAATAEIETELNRYTVPYLHPEDQKLVETLNMYPDTVLASTVFLNPEHEETWNYEALLEPIFKLESSENFGIAKVVPDDDGVIRRVPMYFSDYQTSEIKDSFDVKVVKNALNLDQLSIPLQNGEMIVNYFGPPYSYNYISFVDAFNGDIKASDINDKIVLIGVSEETLKDSAMTPLSKITPTPGVEIHANVIQTVLDQQFLENQTNLSTFLVVCLIVLISVFIFMYLPLYVNIPYLLVFYGIYYLVAKNMFTKGLILAILVPFLAVLTAFIATYLYRFFTEKKRAREMKSAFSHYVSKDVVEKISKTPEMLKLGGQKQVVTVFFSDIVGFTSMSEKMPPEQVVSQLNEYFSVMTRIIFDNKGTLDKFEGDAIMAFYNAPLSDKYHAVHACNTALQCRKVLTKLNQLWKEKGKPMLDFRVGINTGEVIVGNIGSKERFDYTVIGDSVNLASRLEGANKEYGTRILVSEDTYNLVKNYFIFREIGLFEVKGKEKPVKVYELVDKKIKV